MTCGFDNDLTVFILVAGPTKFFSATSLLTQLMMALTDIHEK